MGIQIVSGAIYASEPSFIVDVGIFVAGSISHLGSTEDCAPSQIIMFGRGPSSSTPISIKIMEKSSMELGGSTSTLPSGDRAVFLDSRPVSAATASLSVASVELCGIECTTTL
jgi:hypothetical protein